MTKNKQSKHRQGINLVLNVGCRRYAGFIVIVANALLNKVKVKTLVAHEADNDADDCTGTISGQ